MFEDSRVVLAHNPTRHTSMQSVCAFPAAIAPEHAGTCGPCALVQCGDCPFVVRSPPAYSSLRWIATKNPCVMHMSELNRLRVCEPTEPPQPSHGDAGAPCNLTAHIHVSFAESTATFFSPFNSFEFGHWN